MRLESIVTTASANYFGVSLTDAKNQLRIHASDNTYDHEVSRLIRSGTQWMERRYGISIITQTRTQKMDSFYPTKETYPSRYAVDLLYAPVQSVTSIKYIDDSGVEQTLTAGTDFYTAGLMTPTLGAQDIARGRVIAANSWPSTKWIDESVKIVYVCGYGDDDTFVPEVIKEAILKYVSFHFEERKEEVMGSGMTVAKFEMGIDKLMSTFENFRFVASEC